MAFPCKWALSTAWLGPGGEDWTSALRTVGRRSFVLEEAPNGFGRLEIVVQPSNQRLHQWHSWSQAGDAVATALYSI
jgi:hypothetical protein